ncbi:bestrophin family protein [Pseudomonas sp. RIT-PI-S]|uniref:bestrophin family protein n=1 Tax=Pseudomonas sp. RIT-PI-S TaxID=3035295 RepID=UPI0021DB3656|nr:bestrophin family protein [Pseudomonas sp. RIT-PI-S]
MIVRDQKPSVAVLLFAVKGSIIPAIWPKVLFTVLVSTLVLLTHGTVFNFHMVLTPVPFTLWGLTLAICLGFRNTVAYQRFWEARTFLGELAMASRNLARQLGSLLPRATPSQRLAVAGQLLGFIHLVRDQLRGLAPGADAQRWLEVGTLAPVDPPQGANVALRRLAEGVMNLATETGASDMVKVQLDQQLCTLTHALSGCEKIKLTPIPFPYILMMHRVVHIYCLLLPFCLVDSIGWFTPFAVCVLAYMFFGLDALGDQIANPFDTQPNALPLDAICRQVEINVLELLGEPAPAPLQPVAGVLL